MFSDAKNHAIYRILNTPLRHYPFTHLYVEEVFPPAFYQEMQRQRLPDAVFQSLVKVRGLGGNFSPQRFSFFPRDLPQAALPESQRHFWQQLFESFLQDDFLNAWRRPFGAAFKAHATHYLKQKPPGTSSAVTREMLLLRDFEDYLLGPHSDRPSKLLSVLIYLAPDETRPELGTSLYLPKDRAFTCEGKKHHKREDFDWVATLPYRPNSLLAFPKSLTSFHGVEPVPTARTRDLLLYDVQFAAG